jgi:hypothetical protein
MPTPNPHPSTTTSTPLIKTYYLPPPSLAQSQPLQPPPSSTTWPPPPPPPPPPTTTSDPITLETWGPVFYEPKRRKPHGEKKERKVKNGYLEPLSPTSSDSEPDPACEKKPKKKTKADTKTNQQAQTPPRKRKGNVRTPPKPDLELSGQEERHTTETIEHIPASEGGGGGGGGVRKTYVTTVRITTVRVERPFVEKGR